MRKRHYAGVCVGSETIWTLAQSDLSYAAWVKMKREGGRKASLQSYVQRLGFFFFFCYIFVLRQDLLYPQTPR